MHEQYVDSFYLWRKGDHDLFWKAVESSDVDAKAMLLDVLRNNTTGDPEKLVSGYLSHIRRFRLFLASDGTVDVKPEQSSAAGERVAPVQYRRKSDIDVPTPSKEQVKYYLNKWDELENYHLQEECSMLLACIIRHMRISRCVLEIKTIAALKQSVQWLCKENIL